MTRMFTASDFYTCIFCTQLFIAYVNLFLCLFCDLCDVVFECYNEDFLISLYLCIHVTNQVVFFVTDSLLSHQTVASGHVNLLKRLRDLKPYTFACICVTYF